VRAKLANWTDISDVALLKRLRNGEEWLRLLCIELRQENVAYRLEEPGYVVSGIQTLALAAARLYHLSSTLPVGVVELIAVQGYLMRRGSTEMQWVSNKSRSGTPTSISRRSLFSASAITCFTAVYPAWLDASGPEGQSQDSRTAPAPMSLRHLPTRVFKSQIRSHEDLEGWVFNLMVETNVADEF
jgi:hypothetical protein